MQVHSSGGNTRELIRSKASEPRGRSGGTAAHSQASIREAITSSFTGEDPAMPGMSRADKEHPQNVQGTRRELQLEADLECLNFNDLA